MEIEHSVHCYPIGPDLQGQVDALIKEGWDLVPGVPPVAVYHLQRVKKPVVETKAEEFPAGPPVAFKMVIDESKVMVRKAGS